MLFKKQKPGINIYQRKYTIIFLPLVIAIILMFSACSATTGSIVILEHPNGTGFVMDFKEWSSRSKYELSLNKGEVLQLDVTHEAGEINLKIRGKNGSEPYTGNELESGVFTVTVSEKDEYMILITGNEATGKIIVKNVGTN